MTVSGSFRPRRQLRWTSAADDSSPRRHVSEFLVRVDGALAPDAVNEAILDALEATAAVR